MKKFVPLDLGLEYTAEYTPFPIPRGELVTEWLNTKAAEGWKLIAVDQGVHYFERKAKKITSEK